MLPQLQDLSITIPKIQTKCQSDMLTIQKSAKLQNPNRQVANQSLTFLAQKHLQHIQSINSTTSMNFQAHAQWHIWQFYNFHSFIFGFRTWEGKSFPSFHFIYVNFFSCFPFFSHADYYYDFSKGRRSRERANERGRRREENHKKIIHNSVKKKRTKLSTSLTFS